MINSATENGTKKNGNEIFNWLRDTANLGDKNENVAIQRIKSFTSKRKK